MATSHYLNQLWLDYWRIYASFGLNELNLYKALIRCIKLRLPPALLVKNLCYHNDFDRNLSARLWTSNCSPAPNKCHPRGKWKRERKSFHCALIITVGVDNLYAIYVFITFTKWIITIAKPRNWSAHFELTIFAFPRGDTFMKRNNLSNQASMGPTWVLSAPDGTHVGPMNLAISVV